MPEITVIIPAYNGEKTIRETIDSVLQQTFQDFELIVVDDGSRDRTVEVVHSVGDERIQVFSYENGGLPTARNRGISRASSKFITFIDADDLWTTDKLERQLAALKRCPEAGVAYSWTSFMNVDQTGELVSFLPSPQYSYSGNVYEQLLIGDFILSGSNVMIRREAIAATGEFEASMKSCEDWDYWLRLAARWPFVVVPKYQILYRRTANSMSSKVETMKEASLVAIERAYRLAPPNLQHLKTYTLTNFHTYCAALYLQHRSDRQAVLQAQQHLVTALRLHPRSLLEPTNQKLVLKFLLKRLFPVQMAAYLIDWMRAPIAISDPRLSP